MRREERKVKREEKKKNFKPPDDAFTYYFAKSITQQPESPKSFHNDHVCLAAEYR